MWSSASNTYVIAFFRRHYIISNSCDQHILIMWLSRLSPNTEMLGEYMIYAYIEWSMHTSSDLCIHRVIYAYIEWSMHTSSDLCIHRVIYAYIEWSMHTSSDLCIHRVIYAYIEWSMHTSSDLCIHRVMYAYIDWYMCRAFWYMHISLWYIHISCDLCIHRLIYHISLFIEIFLQTAPHIWHVWPICSHWTGGHCQPTDTRVGETANTVNSLWLSDAVVRCQLICTCNEWHQFSPIWYHAPVWRTLFGNLPTLAYLASAITSNTFCTPSYPAREIFTWWLTNIVLYYHAHAVIYYNNSFMSQYYTCL